MWGLGVISYLMVSGGVSPFWAGSRYRIMSRIINCDYNFNQPNFELVTETARDFITRLLITDPEERMTASECLQHPWLTHIGLSNGLRLVHKLYIQKYIFLIQ